MIVDVEGNLINDLAFEYGEETATFNGCGATLLGEFWYFGGGRPNTNTYKRQVCDSKVFITKIMKQYQFKVSKIEGCSLKRQADMDFDFYKGKRLTIRNGPYCTTIL